MLHGIVVIDALLVAPLGEQAIAALGVASAVGGLVLGVLLAFTNATQIRIAQAIGSAEPLRIKSALLSGLAVNLAIAALGGLALWLGAPRLLAIVAPNADVAVQAQRYLGVFLGVIVAEAIGQNATSYFNGAGNTRYPLYSYLFGVPVNIGVSIVLIHGLLGAPAMGVTGAAIGSVVASSLQAIVLLTLLRRPARALLAVEGWQGGTLMAALIRHLRFSWPIAATFVSAALATNVCLLLYARLDINDFAALTLVTPWIVVAGTVGMSWAQASGIIVAQLLGRRVAHRELDTFLGGAWRAAFLAAALVAAAYLLLCVFADRIYPGLQPVTRDTLSSFWPLLVLLPFPKQSNAMCGNTLRAAGETVYVMHVFVWSQWLFRVPATALLVLYVEATAFWVLSLLLLEELVKFPAFHRRLFAGDWKRRPIET